MPTEYKSEFGSAYRRLDARSAVMLLGAALTLTGCLVGPNYKKPVLKGKRHLGREQPTDLYTAALGQRMVENLQRSNTRTINPTRLHPEPNAAGCGTADYGGSGGARYRGRQSISAD